MIYHFNWCVIDSDQIELFILLIIVTAIAHPLLLRGKLCHNLPSFGGIYSPCHLVVSPGWGTVPPTLTAPAHYPHDKCGWWTSGQHQCVPALQPSPERTLSGTHPAGAEGPFLLIILKPSVTRWGSWRLECQAIVDGQWHCWPVLPPSPPLGPCLCLTKWMISWVWQLGYWY